jgi:hypothetical protein
MLPMLSIGILACLCAPPATAIGARQKKPPARPAAANARLEPFVGKLSEAKTSARERNVPILIHIVIEGEAQNDEYREKILPDKELVAASAGVIVIVANNGTHPKKTIEETVDGQKVKREVCSVYGCASCAEHQRFWDDVYRDFKEDTGEMFCPQTIVLAPDGQVATRINTHAVPHASEILAALKEAELKAGPGLSAAELVEVKRLLGEGQALTAAQGWPDGVRTWHKLLAITTHGTWADQGRAGLAVAEAGLASELERGTALLVPGHAAEGYKALADLGRDCAGLPIEKEIKVRLSKAERTRELRAEIAAYKLEVEADTLLREAQALVDAKQEKKAEHVVRRLLAPRFASTPAAAQARQLWPDLAKAVEAKTTKK